MRLWTILCFICWSYNGSGQSLSEFTYLNELYGDRELYIGINPTFSFVSNKKAPYPENHSLAGFSGDVSLRKVNFSRGKLSWNWQHKMFADIFLLLGKALTETNANILYRAEETGITCGVIGWLDFTWGCNKPDGRFQWALGINHHDYFYASTYVVDSLSGSWASFDPQGYFFAAGPTIRLNYLLNDAFMLELSSSYSFSYWKALDLTYATNPDPNYPLPHFGQVDLELQSKWGLFTGMNYNRIINRGAIPSAGKRLDLIFGFRFMI